MECNKEEAIRAQELSEKKLREKDYAGAKRFALKAQALYPGLEGISQILTTVEVYICGENKINGEVDWYSVLGVDPLSDDDAIRKQYRKLALVLHPDKNKFVGADGAFKFISEAWSLLSDKSRRLAYNQRRNFKVPTMMPRGNGFHNPPRPAATNANANADAKSESKGNTNVQRTAAHRNMAPQAKVNSSTSQRTDTFWTLCRRCKMHYEYIKLYLNNTLLCPNCHQPFVASETAPPANFSKLSNSSSCQPHHQNSNGVDQLNHANIQQSFNSRPTGFPSSGPHVSKNTANTVQQENILKREHEVSVAKEESVLKKARGVNDSFRAFERNNMTEGPMGNGAAGMRNISSFFTNNNVQGFSGVFKTPNRMRDLTPLEIKNLLVKRAQNEILKMLDSLSKTEEGSWKEKKLSKKDNDKKDKSSKSSGPSLPSPPQVIDDEESIELSSITVPDPDFHDFDRDRNETSFGDSEVWAAYDDKDGMPRFYALIHKVLSVKPFKLRMSWLNSKSTSEFSPLKWTNSGFTKTCGEFWVGKHEQSNSLNSFSHKVKWEKGPKGSIFIFPKKDDIWALYRNWSPDWNEHTQDEVINVYDMVKVLDDYSQEGVSVVALVKAAGFKTVYHPCTDPDKVRRIPKEEMFRFSHQVPSYLLTGDEGKGAPEGYYELDPAATSMELLRVLT